MRVILIGDSIRLGSEADVRSRVPEDWRILSPVENCQSSNELKRHLEAWLEQLSFDPTKPLGPQVIHLNCGLHDIRFNQGANHPVTSLEAYEANLEWAFNELANKNIQVIWATSTPFLESVHNREKVSRRYIQDLLEYNEVSKILASKYNFYINDLYQKLMDVDYQRYLLPDGLHFNDEGYCFIGECVTESLIQVSRDAFGTVHRSNR